MLRTPRSKAVTRSILIYGQIWPSSDLNLASDGLDGQVQCLLVGGSVNNGLRPGSEGPSFLHLPWLWFIEPPNQTKPTAAAAPIKYNYVCLDWEEAVGSISGGSLAGDRADMRAGACNGQTTDHWCTIYLMLAIALSKQSNQL